MRLAQFVHDHEAPLSTLAHDVMTSYPQVLVNVEVAARHPQVADELAVELAAAEREHCDLIAMAVHGHKGIQDVLYGTTANAVRHRTMVPVLLVRGPVRLVSS
jgi:nucleotide-binding universal stress UspA family protein